MSQYQNEQQQTSIRRHKQIRKQEATQESRSEEAIDPFLLNDPFPQVRKSPPMHVSEPNTPEFSSQIEQTMGGGLTRFFNSLKDVTTEALLPGLLGVVLFPIIGPLGALAAVGGTAAFVHAIQDKLVPLDLHLQNDTLRKIVEPFGSNHIDEGGLQRVIGEKVLPDQQANEDLRQFFNELLPIIQYAREKSPNIINIYGDAYGLINGDNNTVTQTFNLFLQEETGMSGGQVNEELTESLLNQKPVINHESTQSTQNVDWQEDPQIPDPFWSYPPTQNYLDI